ncbi:hypothetical protein [Desulfosporosinus meridiei]|uniref:Uncharacterized protein n=1 Tax=Desulfosporosinus meridiei (strain ATCC BAA-275 / DSM 13257 / KCTC 12902 / NCIMB 13706 / S10) TaxID=768704 RepID=J7IQF6_DESMD|nr:hypothetical protein [Desulfosporosinus meridiei]AFQ42399.1 hypothetical protein Desmer_0338 [Desulfosporosinus meridiei DSM 13257]
MPYLSTGLLENPLVEGIWASPTLSVNITNDDISTVAIQIEGFSQTESTNIKYVEEFFTLASGAVVLKNYFIPFNTFEFKFFASSQSVEISVWCKDSDGNLISVPLGIS